MTDRNRLIELIDKAKEEYAGDVTDHTETDYIAECLLNNGVIVPPCKVGDTIYCIDEHRQIKECRVTRLDIDHNSKVVVVYEEKSFFCRRYGGIADGFGKVTFLTKEEAEAKLKEMNDNAKM